MRKNIAVLLSFVLILSLVSCAGLDSREQKGTAGGAAIGAATGAVLGQAIGRNTKGTVLGAAAGALIGGIAGNRIGAYMDQQEQSLRNVAAASDAVSVQRTQDVLTATFKSDVLFDFDSSVLKPGAYSEINRVANILNQYPETMIRVEGHTDTKGSEAYNQKLSERRAESVKSALVQRGIHAARIETAGLGKSMPISSDDAANRRVDIVIVPVRRG